MKRKAWIALGLFLLGSNLFWAGYLLQKSDIMGFLNIGVAVLVFGLLMPNGEGQGR